MLITGNAKKSILLRVFEGIRYIFLFLILLAGPFVIVANVSAIGQNLNISVLDFEPKPGNWSFRDLACGYMPTRTSNTMIELAVFNPRLHRLQAVIPMPTAFIGRVDVSSGNLSFTVSPLLGTDLDGAFLCKLTYYANGYLREVESKRIVLMPGKLKLAYEEDDIRKSSI